MRAKLKAIKQELRQRMHQSIPVQGKWLGQVVKGYFNFHAVPTNSRALGEFRHRVTKLWRHVLQHRSHKAEMTWDRTRKLANDWLPGPRVLHPWPSVSHTWGAVQNCHGPLRNATCCCPFPVLLRLKNSARLLRSPGSMTPRAAGSRSRSGAQARGSSAGLVPSVAETPHLHRRVRTWPA